MEKERPSADGKSAGSNLFHLGRGADLVEWNNTVEALLLNQSDYSVDTVKVNYDLKNNNASKILSDLNSTLKSEKINLDIAAQIKDNFEHTLNSDLVIEAYVITYTINFDLLDSIRKAANGRPSGMRFKLAAENLKAAKKPLIREVKVIEERCQFRNSTSLKNILEPILKLKLGNENPKVNLVLNATLSKERTSVFSSSYRRTSLYSYGYFNDKWMMQ